MNQTVRFCRLGGFVILGTTTQFGRITSGKIALDYYNGTKFQPVLETAKTSPEPRTSWFVQEIKIFEVVHFQI